MASTLIFPDGVRLATQDEIPGPEPSRSEHWSRIQSANIAPGFVLKAVDDDKFTHFTHYAEINVDAPHIWLVFRDLCRALLWQDATLILGEIDAELVTVACAPVPSIFDALEPHAYQLAHDGLLQFGCLVVDGDGVTDEVFVAPTKHFKVWLNDEPSFRSVMERHGLREADRLEFLDEYPRTTVTLPASTGVREVGQLLRQLQDQIGARP